METNVLAVMSPIALGMRLARARHASCLTEQQTADAIGMTRTDIVAIEHGERQPRARELVKLAQFYGYPIQDFVRTTPQPFAPTGNEVLEQDCLMAVRAYLAAELTEAQLARYLGTDIVSARDLVLRAALDPTMPDENN